MSSYSAQAAVAELTSTISGFRSNIDGQMDRVRQTTDNIQETTQLIHGSVAQFKRDLIRSEEVQLAQENIIRIDQVLKEQFGDYAAIRRTIMGVVHDFDINLVRNKTIQELSEELWLTSSRYWLSYALIAITAWVNDYPEVAANALSECSHRDKIKASLFFTLFNLRFGRNEAARAWFCHYLTTLDPKYLQNEASVMIEAYLSGVFGRDRSLQAQVDRTIEQWIAVIAEDAELAEQLVQDYAKFIDLMPAGMESPLQAARQFCTNVAEMESTWRDESKYGVLLSLVQSLDVPDPVEGQDDYKARIDAVLGSLITNYDRDEEELREQQDYYNLVVRNGGDVGSAEAQYQEMLRQKHEGTNVGRKMVSWVLYDADTQVHVRKFALAHTKEWFREAIERFSDRVHAAMPTGYKLAIDGWESLSTGDDYPQQEMMLRQHFESHRTSLVFLTMPNIIAGLAAIACVGLCFVSLYALIGVVVALGFLGFSIYRALQEYPQRVARAVANLTATMAEIAQFKMYCAQCEDVRTQLLEQLEYGFLA